MSTPFAGHPSGVARAGNAVYNATKWGLNGWFYNETAITAADIADVIAFAIARPRRMTLNEIFIRPTAQAL